MEEQLAKLVDQPMAELWETGRAAPGTSTETAARVAILMQEGRLPFRRGSNAGATSAQLGQRTASPKEFCPKRWSTATSTRISSLAWIALDVNCSENCGIGGPRRLTISCKFRAASGPTGKGQNANTLRKVANIRIHFE